MMAPALRLLVPVGLFGDEHADVERPHFKRPVLMC